MKDITGKAWIFGDDVSTDHIAPGRYFHLRSNLKELAKHVLEDADPDFASKVNEGDLVVGGNNFGLGSSREHAPLIIKVAGVGAILAKSFARIFYRNSINIGLPLVVCDTSRISQGDKLEIDIANGVLINNTQGYEVSFQPLPGFMMRILEDGGLVEHIKKNGDFVI